MYLIMHSEYLKLKTVRVSTFKPIGTTRTWMFLATFNVTSLVASEVRIPRRNMMDGQALRDQGSEASNNFSNTFKLNGLITVLCLNSFCTEVHLWVTSPGEG